MNRLKNSSITLPFSIISFVISFYLLFNDIKSDYALMYLMPFSLGIMLFFVNGLVGHKQAHIGNLLILVLIFVKNSIIPLLMFIGDYYTVVKSHVELYTSHSIILCIYEMIFVLLTFIYANKIKVKKKKYILADNYILMRNIVLICTLYCLVIFVLYPQTWFSFKTIFDLGNEEFTTSVDRNEGYSSGSIGKILITLYTVVFNVVRVLLPILVVRFLLKKHVRNKLFFTVLILLLLIQFLFITSTFAESIVSALIVLLAVLKLKPESTTYILKFSALSVVTVICSYFIIRYNVSSGSLYAGNSFSQYVCSIVHAYFGGIDNITAVFSLPDINKWDYFFNTLKGTVPFNTTLFGKHGDVFQTLYNSVSFSHGQIPPTICSGYFFMGPLLSPLFSCLLTFYSVKFSINALTTSSFVRYVSFVFISVVLALGISMYNDSIALTWCLGWGLPLYLISIVSSRRI